MSQRWRSVIVSRCMLVSFQNLISRAAIAAPNTSPRKTSMPSTMLPPAGMIVSASATRTMIATLRRVFIAQS